MSFAAMKLCIVSQWMFIFVSVKYDPRSAFIFASESGKLHRKSRRIAPDLLLLPRIKSRNLLSGKKKKKSSSQKLIKVITNFEQQH